MAHASKLFRTFQRLHSQSEFEGSGMNAARTLGLQNVNVGYLSARLTAVPLKFGRISILAGAGVYFFGSALADFGLSSLPFSSTRWMSNTPGDSR